MTDHTTQSLRRAASTGDLDSEARLLRARLRDGTLTEDRLRLAALLGHEGARAAFACGHDDITGGPGLAAWLRALEPFKDTLWGPCEPCEGTGHLHCGACSIRCRECARCNGAGKVKHEPSVLLRGSVAVARACLPKWDGRYRGPMGEDEAVHALRAVEAAEAWIATGELEWDGIHPPDHNPLDWWYYLRLLLWDLSTGPQQLEQVSRFLIEAAAKLIGEPATRKAVADSLLPVALGESDPSSIFHTCP